MNEILKKVPYPDYNDFRERAMEKLHWSRDQYNNRYQGRTRITYAERAILLQIAAEINGNK